MSGKPQEARADEQEDLLEQIITQGLDKIKAPEQATAGLEAPANETSPAPKQESSRETAPPTEKKNRQSAVYLYLLILFGAAFLLLLLAYFVQQRNSETTISDLRESMSLSREQLLAQIEDMEEQNTALTEKIAQLQNDLAQWRELYEEKDRERTDLLNRVYAASDELYSYSTFLQLEWYYLEEDYESCAAILVFQMQSQFGYRTPNGAEERQKEIINAVVDAGILDEDYLRHPENYKDLLDAYFDRQTND